MAAEVLGDLGPCVTLQIGEGDTIAIPAEAAAAIGWGMIRRSVTALNMAATDAMDAPACALVTPKAMARTPGGGFLQ